jgi:phosphatidylinositol phospholipase C, gamma-1
MTLGTLQKGSIDVVGAVVELVIGNEANGVAQWVVRVQNPVMCTPFDMAAPTKESAIEWHSAIKEAAHSASARSLQHKEMERTWRIAKDMSDLIIYCRSVAFNLERAKTKNPIFYEMSSFVETKAEKLICQLENPFFLKYHRTQFSRVYPKGQRIDSSNYNPIPMWNSGCQMVALNYQTADKPMQINTAKFKENGGCGYILRPEFMFHDSFNPSDKRTLVNVRPITVHLRVIGARNLSKSGRGTASPFVEVELLGADYDCGVKLVTKTICNNFSSINPFHFSLTRFLFQPTTVSIRPGMDFASSTSPIPILRC